MPSSASVAGRPPGGANTSQSGPRAPMPSGAPPVRVARIQSCASSVARSILVPYPSSASVVIWVPDQPGAADGKDHGPGGRLEVGGPRRGDGENKQCEDGEDRFHDGSPLKSGG